MKSSKGERMPSGAVVLQVDDVHAQSSGDTRKDIVKGLDLVIREGEVHAIMGPNGSGKSTLSKILIGDPAYLVTAGRVNFSGQDLLEMEPHERALNGLFMAFQSPPAVSGVSNLDFLRAAHNAGQRHRGEPESDVFEFYSLATSALERLGLRGEFLDRNVNEGFSGGERKRNEMLQMALLKPKLALLDEIDSGLDIDALKDVAQDLARTRAEDPTRSFLIVTHNERFLQYVQPDFVHVLQDGRIVASGDKDLARQIDSRGYEVLLENA